jgi:hypothetical protein
LLCDLLLIFVGGCVNLGCRLVHYLLMSSSTWLSLSILNINYYYQLVFLAFIYFWFIIK